MSRVHEPITSANEPVWRHRLHIQEPVQESRPRLRKVLRRFIRCLTKVVRFPPFGIGLLAYFCFVCSLGFTAATLSVFLQSLYHPGRTVISLLLSLQGVGMLFAPIIGYVCDRFRVFMPFQCIGFALIGIPFFLIAPIPLLQLGEPQLWLSVVCLVAQGLAVGFFVPSMSGDLVEMSRFAVKDDAMIERTVVALMVLCQALGLCCGFTVGGTMKTFGFSTLAIGFGLFECCVGLLWLTFLLFSKSHIREFPRRQLRESPEQQEILLHNLRPAWSDE